MAVVLWCLHGNFQTPAVWSPLRAHLHTHLPQVQVRTENLWDTVADSPTAWASDFCRRCQQETLPRQAVLLGYSLGGRLALQAVLGRPALWAMAMIVAADPGPQHDPGRTQQRDRHWANRCLTEPWEQVLADWNRLPIFAQRPNLAPIGSLARYRSPIAQAFISYSKSKINLRPALAKLLAPPVIYITGADDQKYSAIGRQLNLFPAIQHIQIASAAHRVPWEAPTNFHQQVATCLRALTHPP